MFDFSSTLDVVTDWIRFVYRLAESAKRAGKEVIVAGMPEHLLEKTDLIALRKRFAHADSVEEALRR